MAAVPLGTGYSTFLGPSLSLPGLLLVPVLDPQRPSSSLGVRPPWVLGLAQLLSDSGPHPLCPCFSQGPLICLLVLTGSHQACCSSTESYCLFHFPLSAFPRVPRRTHFIQTASPHSLTAHHPAEEPWVLTEGEMGDRAGQIARFPGPCPRGPLSHCPLSVLCTHSRHDSTWYSTDMLATKNKASWEGHSKFGGLPTHQPSCPSCDRHPFLSPLRVLPIPRQGRALRHARNFRVS